MQPTQATNSFSPQFNNRLKRRYRAEQRFKLMGIGAIFVALAFLVFLISTIMLSGYSAFKQTYIKLDVTLDKEYFPGEDLARGDFQGIVKASLYRMFPEVSGRSDKRLLTSLVSKGAAAAFADFSGNFVSLRFTAHVVDNHIGTGFAKRNGHRLADSRSTAGNQRFLPFQYFLHRTIGHDDIRILFNTHDCASFSKSAIGRDLF